MPSPTWLLVVLVAFATYRLTRLITRDSITDRPRNWLARRYQGWVVNLSFCPWCMSMWLAGPVVVLAVYCWAWWSWVMVALTASAVTGQLSEHE